MLLYGIIAEDSAKMMICRIKVGRENSGDGNRSRIHAGGWRCCLSAGVSETVNWVVVGW